jgi:hypothetical protein
LGSREGSRSPFAESSISFSDIAYVGPGFSDDAYSTGNLLSEDWDTLSRSYLFSNQSLLTEESNTSASNQNQTAAPVDCDDNPVEMRSRTPRAELSKCCNAATHISRSLQTDSGRYSSRQQPSLEDEECSGSQMNNDTGHRCQVESYPLGDEP